MIRNVVFGFILLQVGCLYSVDMRSILKRSHKKTKVVQHVYFEKNNEKLLEDKLIEDQKTESFVSYFDRSRQALKEDLDCCMNSGQLLRFSMIGCCVFCLGYSYGSADCSRN